LYILINALLTCFNLSSDLFIKKLRVVSLYKLFGYFNDVFNVSLFLKRLPLYILLITFVVYCKILNKLAWTRLKLTIGNIII